MNYFLHKLIKINWKFIGIIILLNKIINKPVDNPYWNHIKLWKI